MKSQAFIRFVVDWIARSDRCFFMGERSELVRSLSEETEELELRDGP